MIPEQLKDSIDRNMASMKSCGPAQTAVVFTVDVEGKKGLSDLPDQLDLEIGGVKCGLNGILDIADMHNIKMTFFVDVYEIKKPFGTGPVKRLTKHIFDRGHDVQLHTHPGPFYEYKRNKMYQFSATEQEEIIKIGANFIHEWTGYYPEAHRAGAYAANKQTISALKHAGIRLDSSYFQGHRNCKLEGNFPYHNELYQMGNILELPVTIYELYEHPCFFQHFFPPIFSIKKIDIDASSLFEMKEAISNAIESKYSTITIFMHSFSLIRNDKTPDLKNIQKLEKLMRWVGENGFQTATARDLLTNIKAKVQPTTQTGILKVTKRINLIKYLLKRLRQQKKRIWA